MPKVVRSAQIPLPPDKLWTIMRDVNMRPRWDVSVCRLEREDGSNVNATTLLRYTAPLMLGLTWRWEGEYSSYNPPERSAVRMQWGSMFRPFRKLAGSWILTPDEQGTLLKITVQFEPRIALFEGLVTRRVSRVTTESLIRLRQLTMDSSI